ncbi:hypothetical protein [Terricaulis silvestris]|uniref:hypothetical protein n=1 Tax=Terricaulis silvestris TaxID=2686094 RepID=UPI00131E8500|nr:hypothetical protein [Terricaulis silvestris]
MKAIAGFILAASTLLAAACSQSVEEVLPIETIHLNVPIETRSDFVRTLRGYADEGGYRVGIRTGSTSRWGEPLDFELRRRDFSILGHCVLLDGAPSGIIVADGRPQIDAAIDPEMFEVSFYPGNQGRSDAQYSAMIDRFVGRVDALEGVEVVTGEGPQFATGATGED